MAGHWFSELADHMGPAYLRYSFTKGTAQEVDALVELLALVPGERVLDLGCGPGRHSLELASRGFDVIGIDISRTFIELASKAAADAGLSDRARFLVADARTLADPTRRGFSGEVDAAISLCQGAFGLAGGPDSLDELPRRELDEPIVAGLAAVLRPGGRAAISAFSAYFQVRYLEDHDTFDVVNGVNHEVTEVRDGAGQRRPADLWTTCFTPRELRLLARLAGLTPRSVFGVTPGDYGPHPATLDRPEFLLIADRIDESCSSGRSGDPDC